MTTRMARRDTEIMTEKKRGLPAGGYALLFGVIAATVEMAVILWMMYC